jgi:NAD(P)-dependent dehydrogenase (short-subunit alcohol dehydrogenase family)
MTKKVCAVVGVGPGNGAALARRFSKEGYAVALLARTTETSAGLAAGLPDARAYACDVTDAAAVAQTFAAIQRDMGPVHTLVYNAGTGTWGTVEEIDPSVLEGSFRVNTLGLLLSAKQVIPQMKAQGGGNIVVVGATSSRRGMAKTAGFAPGKAAQKSLTESMARHLWPANIHVALVIVDGVVDLPRTRAMMKDKPDDFFIAPDDLADTAFHLTVQPRSAWSFEVEARPFKESW